MGERRKIDVFGKAPQPYRDAGHAMRRALWSESSLELDLRELVRIHSAQINGCRY
jgi:hypothetical protein